MIPVSKVFPHLTRLAFAWEVEEWGWRIGDHSYGKPQVLDPEYARLEIGRFCSIGPGVSIVLGNHRTDLVTTYPFKTLGHLWPEAAVGTDDHEARGDVVLGNDIWVGAGATILSGARIGSGAVIGAGAVVRGEVPPYAVMAGNPATLRRCRFDEATVERLLRVAWWNWADVRLRNSLHLLMSNDISAFLAAAERSA